MPLDSSCNQNERDHVNASIPSSTSPLRKANHPHRAIDNVPMRSRVAGAAGGAAPLRGAGLLVDKAAPRQERGTSGPHADDLQSGHEVTTLENFDSDDEFSPTPSLVDALSEAFSLSQESQSQAFQSQESQSQESQSQESPSLSPLQSSLAQLSIQSPLTSFEYSPNTPDSPNSDRTAYYSAEDVDKVRGKDEGIKPATRSILGEVEFLASLPTLEERCNLSWPKLPTSLRSAPFPARWEILRAALHCSVEPGELDLVYDAEWAADQGKLWAALAAHPSFAGKNLPPVSDPELWQDIMKDGSIFGHRVVVFAATATKLSRARVMPFMRLQLRPLQKEKGNRIYRRFGSDRFIELTIPSIHDQSCQLFNSQRAQQVNRVITWLSESKHRFAARKWTAFYTRYYGLKQPEKTSALEMRDSRPVPLDRVYLFAEEDEGSQYFQRYTRKQMLDWLLQLDMNRDQPALKLFSRIALGLSTTTPLPEIAFDDHQIIHHPGDFPKDHKVAMNDGIARISPALMSRVTSDLGIHPPPAAFQGRFGSAKGMWIVDHTDKTGDEWIETFCSQRKWVCRWEEKQHRTLELKSWSSELKPALLNTQFLMILQDRARNKAKLFETLRDRVQTQLAEDLDLTRSLESPEAFRQWIRNNSSSFVRAADMNKGHEFLGGLPDSKIATLERFIDAGFDPRRMKFAWDIVSEIQEHNCQKLLTKINIKLKKSTWAFMVVDFSELLEPNEVHLSFSNRFKESPDDMTGPRFLSNRDILVGRCPAHFASDIQKVKAVFKEELDLNQDVIYFSTKGLQPLAERLSGGDYDGDKAWICFDPDIVDNFDNVEDLPPMPNLKPYMTEDKTTLAEILEGSSEENYVDEMIRKAFHFSMQPSLLGMATTYKEKLCYGRNSISNDSAIALSWLLREIADQTKRGITFTNEDWWKFVKDHCDDQRNLATPAYKQHWERGVESSLEHIPLEHNSEHLIDFLIFDVIVPAIRAERQGFRQITQALNERPSASAMVPDYDRDLTILCDELDGQTKTWDIEPTKAELEALSRLMSGLQEDIHECAALWSKIMAEEATKGDQESQYRVKVQTVYEKWRLIKPRDEEYARQAVRGIGPILQQEYLRPELRGWELLKASMTFKLYHRRKHTFVWRIAGDQLLYIKSMKVSPYWGVSRANGSTTLNTAKEKWDWRRDAGVVPVRGDVYSILRPDSKKIKQLSEKRDGPKSHVGDDSCRGDSDAEELDDC